jgi:hypothetical protein
MSLQPKPPVHDSDLPPDADAEERFNDFWKKNGSAIFGGIAIGAVLVIGYQLYQHLDANREQKVRAAYTATVTVADKLSFAAANPKHSLGGFAYLEAADQRFADGQHADAAALYAYAETALAGTALAPRARLGRAASLLLSGERAGGMTLFEAIARDGGALEQIRAEAAYHLAVARWQDDDLDGVRHALDMIYALQNAGFWAYRAGELLDRVPGLAP